MKLLSIVLCVLLIYLERSLGRRMWITTDELENHISPEDLREFFSYYQNGTTTAHPDAEVEYEISTEPTTKGPVPDLVDCFGLGSITRFLLGMFNMKPDDARTVNTHFYFSSRIMPKRVQFGLEHVDFKPDRKTVLIVHGFMSYSNASWIVDMTRAFLAWGDVNVIAVDWSGGGNTWKYWRAVANTRRVGHDITSFMKQLMNATNAKVKDFHFVGHSLGAHISSFASYHLGRVARITGLDPAQPCFVTTNDVERLDPTDADFVDIIHTNGRLLQYVGFGMPDPIGHIDFYPNGGLKQPGCFTGTKSFWSRLPISPARLQQAICSHGRAYVLFTESLVNNNCSFQAYRWDLSYEGVNRSLNSTCDRRGSCAEMGISALTSPLARGAYFLLTTEKEPYCVPLQERRYPLLELLRDLRKGIKWLHTTTHPTTNDHTTIDLTTNAPTTEYKDPDLITDSTEVDTTTKRGFFSRWFRFGKK